jgi:hypothetical protein
MPKMEVVVGRCSKEKSEMGSFLKWKWEWEGAQNGNEK